MANLKRPGGELASRPLHFIWVVDCSGSMYGEKIGTVNHAIQSTIPEMADAAKDNPNAQLLVRTLKFSTGASWVTTAPVPIEDFAWDDLDAGGVTDLGKAFEMLAAQLTIPPMSERALPPVLVLLSDGQPTDDYKKSLDKLLHLPWGKKAVRIAISIGQDADDDVLEQFTGNRELVLQAVQRLNRALRRRFRVEVAGARLLVAAGAEGKQGYPCDNIPHHCVALRSVVPGFGEKHDKFVFYRRKCSVTGAVDLFSGKTSEQSQCLGIRKMSVEMKAVG